MRGGGREISQEWRYERPSDEKYRVVPHWTQKCSRMNVWRIRPRACTRVPPHLSHFTPSLVTRSGCSARRPFIVARQHLSPPLGVRHKCDHDTDKDAYNESAETEHAEDSAEDLRPRAHGDAETADSEAHKRHKDRPFWRSGRLYRNTAFCHKYISHLFRPRSCVKRSSLAPNRDSVPWRKSHHRYTPQV